MSSSRMTEYEHAPTRTHHILRLDLMPAMPARVFAY